MVPQHHRPPPAAHRPLPTAHCPLPTAERRTAPAGDTATGVQRLDEPASAIVSAWSMTVSHPSLASQGWARGIRVQVGPACNGSGGGRATEQCWSRCRRRRPMACAEAASWWRGGPWTTWMAAPGMAPIAPRRRAARDSANDATGDAAGQMAVAGRVNNQIPWRRRPWRALDLEAWCALALLQRLQQGVQLDASPARPRLARGWRLEAVDAPQPAPQLVSPLPCA